MNVVHCISSLDKNDGGPSRSVPLLCNAIAARGHHVELLHTNSPSPVSLVETDFFKIKPFQPDSWFKPFKGSKTLKNYIYSSDPDLFHGHGLWQMPVHYMARAAQAKNIPYIISPRGMLEPGALKFSKWKKKVAGAGFQNTDLSRSACLHATGTLEAENLRRYGLKNPVAIIPNGLAVGDLSESVESRESTEERYVFFMSRIHPKKGLKYLIEAWAELQHIFPEWTLIIAGNDENNYENRLKLQAQKQATSHRIKFVGPVFGAEKKELLRTADIFVLPSLSENFGIVVAEALASGTPVITTKETPWEDLESYKCGWRIHAGKSALLLALKSAMALSPEERSVMGRRGHSLIRDKYAIASVSEKMILLYEWIIHNSRKPDFVYF